MRPESDLLEPQEKLTLGKVLGRALPPNLDVGLSGCGLLLKHLFPEAVLGKTPEPRECVYSAPGPWELKMNL